MVKSEPKIQSEISKPMLSPSSSTSTSTSSSSSSSCKKKYKGVRMRSWGSWVSEIRAPNQKTRIWLGSYSTAEAAARAYDAALICLKGSSANLNFPNMNNNASYQLPNDTVMSPKSIQRVAAAAANSFVEHQQHQHNNVSTPPSPSLTDPPSSSSLSSSSSSSMASSPSMSSSPSELQLIDDSISLAPGLDSTMVMDAAYNYGMIAGDNVSSMVMGNEPWFDLSPKYLDMVNGIFFDPPSMNIEEIYEEGDLSLWSFC